VPAPLADITAPHYTSSPSRQTHAVACEQHPAARGAPAEKEPAAGNSHMLHRAQAAQQAREFHNWRRLKALESEIAALKAGQSPLALPLQALEKRVLLFSVGPCARDCFPHVHTRASFHAATSTQFLTSIWMQQA